MAAFCREAQTGLQGRIEPAGCDRTASTGLYARLFRQIQERPHAQYRLGQEARPHHRPSAPPSITARKTRVRGFIRKVEEAIATGDKKAALAALKAAEPEIMRGVSKGVLHKNTGARKVSRLAKRVAKLQK